LGDLDKSINGITCLEKTIGIVQIRVSIFIFIIAQVKGYLHVVIALSYICTQSRKKAIMSPYSISYRTIDRFLHCC
jgi:hypothetical protein